MFNGVFSSVFNVDASVQAFASNLHTSDISSNDDFIQYPDQADNQTYQNTILNNKSISIPFANQETETKQGIDSTFIDVNSLGKSGTLAGGEQAQLVATSQGLLSEEFPQPEMDRPWFCSVYALAGYHMCDPITNVPKWCQYDITDIWCPDDPGFEYDGATGQGGSSGGAGSSRTWEVEKCFNDQYEPIPCRPFQDRYESLRFIAETGEVFPAPEKNPIITDVGYLERRDVLMDDYIQCVDINNYPISCGAISYITGDFHNKRVDTKYSAHSNWEMFADGCYAVNVFDKSYVKVPCMLNTNMTNIEEEEKNFFIDDSFIFRNFKSGLPISPEGFEGGFPIVPSTPEPEPGSDPFNPDYPETTDECASIICQCISFVVKALEKVDQSILQVVAAVKDLSLDIPAPSPFDISPVTDRLDNILSAIDDISIEMVKEAETNIWDFLGETISTLNDLIQYLIDQIIYLIVPEDTDFLRENFSMLREAMSMKLEPVNMLKTQITASLMTEQQNFEDIHMNLPIYGRVKFLDVEFLNYAVPKIRALISGIMIIVTSVWAYRKITSDMVR